MLFEVVGAAGAGTGSGGGLADADWASAGLDACTMVGPASGFLISGFAGGNSAMGASGFLISAFGGVWPNGDFGASDRGAREATRAAWMSLSTLAGVSPQRVSDQVELAFSD